MPDRVARWRPDRSRLLELLRDELPRLADPLEVLAESLLGLTSRIDLVARDARGQLVLVMLAEPASDLERLGDGLAQRAWVEPRIEDWLKLAPGLGLRPELGARVLLLAPAFDERTRAAAQGLGEDAIQLAALHWRREGAESRLRIEALGALEPGAASARASVFRTGLRASDL